MIEFVIGSLSSLAVISFALACYLLGRKHGETRKSPIPKVDEEERKKQQQLLKDFNEVMAYNEKKAYERRNY